jgi:hypothetical protein
MDLSIGIRENTQHTTMKKTLIFILICCFSQLVNAQATKLTDVEKIQLKALKEVVRLAGKQGDTTIINDYVKRNPLTSSYLYSYYLSSKVDIKAASFWAKKEKRPTVVQRNLLKKDILYLYQKGIDTCQYCSLSARVLRAKFLAQTKDYGPLYKNDMKILTAAGYKRPFGDIDISVQYSYSKSGSWIGASFSPYRYIRPYSNMKQLDKDGKIFSRNVVKPSGYSLFPVSYQYNLANQIHDINISIYQTNAPVYFNITKFGHWQNMKTEKNAFYYRPEIGFGTTYFSVNYGYNVQLNRKEQTTIDKHIFTARYSLIPIKKYFSKKEKIEEVDNY